MAMLLKAYNLAILISNVLRASPFGDEDGGYQPVYRSRYLAKHSTQGSHWPAAACPSGSLVELPTPTLVHRPVTFVIISAVTFAPGDPPQKMQLQLGLWE